MRLLCTLLLLTGCASSPVIEYKYVPAQLPAELLVIPKRQATVPRTDSELALWLLEEERRTRQLELQLEQLKKLNQ